MQSKFQISQFVFWFCTASMALRTFKVHNINLDDSETSIIYSGPEKDRFNQEVSEYLLADNAKDAMDIAEEREKELKTDFEDVFQAKMKIIRELKNSIQ